MKLKDVFYNATIILPIVEKVYKTVKFIITFNANNEEILKARDEIKSSVAYLQQVVNEINDFHHVNIDDGEE